MNGLVVVAAMAIVTVSADSALQAGSGMSRAAKMATSGQPAATASPAAVQSETVNRQAVSECLTRGSSAQTCRDRQPEQDEPLKRRQVEQLEDRIVPAEPPS